LVKEEAVMFKELLVKHLILDKEAQLQEKEEDRDQETDLRSKKV